MLTVKVDRIGRLTVMVDSYRVVDSWLIVIGRLTVMVDSYKDVDCQG